MELTKNALQTMRLAESRGFDAPQRGRYRRTGEGQGSVADTAEILSLSGKLFSFWKNILHSPPFLGGIHPVWEAPNDAGVLRLVPKRGRIAAPDARRAAATLPRSPSTGGGEDSTRKGRTEAPHRGESGGGSENGCIADERIARRVLENAGCGIVQLDWRGRIVAVNGIARTLLARSDGLTDAEGYLLALAPRADATLQKLIARALPRSSAPPASGSMRVVRERMAPRLVVHVSPVSAPPDAMRPIEVAALVLVVDPAWRAPVDPALLASALGFTTTQSQIAAMLASGRSTRDIARATGRTEGTVRWHLKQIYARHGISRQAQVVELVLSLSFLDGVAH